MYQESIEHLGIHLIVDLWGAKNLTNIEIISDALTECVDAIGATLLKIDLHEFSNGGITGVALLAESHMSIHTWPEKNNYAAIDVFVCGIMDAYKTIPVLRKHFSPTNIQISEIKRGIVV
jgi:S-adenosylmethionine decarboxylase